MPELYNWTMNLVKNKYLNENVVFLKTNPTTYFMLKPYSEDISKNTRAHQICKEYVKKRFEKEGLNIHNESVIQYRYSQIKEHYVEHIGRSYFGNLVKLLSSNKAYGMMVQAKNEKDNPLTMLRGIAGSTIKIEEGKVTRFYEPGTIRYDLSFILYQMIECDKNKEEVIIPKSLDECKLEYDKDTHSVKVYKDNNLINVASVSANIIHSSSCYKDAVNELAAFNGGLILDKYKNFKMDTYLQKTRNKLNLLEYEKQSAKLDKRLDKFTTAKAFALNDNYKFIMYCMESNKNGREGR